MYYWFMHAFLVRSGGLDSSLGGSRGEVRLHEALEVEVGELITRSELEERSEGGIRVDLATVLLILECVGADVLVDLAGDLSASHLGALVLAQEGSKLLTDKSGLNKTAGGTVALSAALLSTSLLSSLHLTSPTLLESAELAAEAGKKGVNLLQLLSEISSLVGESGVGGLGLGSSLLNRGLGGGRLGGLGGLSVLLPSGHYILLIRLFFK